MFTESNKHGVVNTFGGVYDVVRHYKKASLNTIMDSIDDLKYNAKELAILQVRITVALRRLNNNK